MPQKSWCKFIYSYIQGFTFELTKKLANVNKFGWGNPENHFRASSGATLMQRKLAIAVIIQRIPRENFQLTVESRLDGSFVTCAENNGRTHKNEPRVNNEKPEEEWRRVKNLKSNVKRLPTSSTEKLSTQTALQSADRQITNTEAEPWQPAKPPELSSEATFLSRRFSAPDKFLPLEMILVEVTQKVGPLQTKYTICKRERITWIARRGKHSKQVAIVYERLGTFHRYTKISSQRLRLECGKATERSGGSFRVDIKEKYFEYYQKSHTHIDATTMINVGEIYSDLSIVASSGETNCKEISAKGDSPTYFGSKHSETIEFA
ncbi:hypothetical protein WN51_12694 [Melipona quadrifasciata]|uniref:Uncharacterized protein n=1 Tax=Melipona quadrifasciata TaxID=166423 RepID=A0A0M9A3C4_9HYME|nr:hypothetical protein WN51_12694 [Melipona quadrifasciata]